MWVALACVAVHCVGNAPALAPGRGGHMRVALLCFFTLLTTLAVSVEPAWRWRVVGLAYAQLAVQVKLHRKVAVRL